MTEKEKRKQRHSAEDAAFNRMLLWLVGAVVAEAVALIAKRLYVDVSVSNMDTMIALFHFFRIFAIVGLVLTIAGVVWCWLCRKKGKKLNLPLICSLIVGFVWILSLLAAVLDETGIKIMTVLPIVAAVLILIYFLYQRSFFTCTILTGGGMAALWAYRQFFSYHKSVITAGFVLGWIILALVSAGAYKMKKNNGKLFGVQIGSAKSAYIVCWITCAVVALAMLLGLILGAGAAYYLIYVLIGWLFCLAVYHTVKLM